MSDPRKQTVYYTHAAFASIPKQTVCPPSKQIVINLIGWPTVVHIKASHVKETQVRQNAQNNSADTAWEVHVAAT